MFQENDIQDGFLLIMIIGTAQKSDNPSIKERKHYNLKKQEPVRVTNCNSLSCLAEKPHPNFALITPVTNADKTTPFIPEQAPSNKTLRGRPQDCGSHTQIDTSICSQPMCFQLPRAFMSLLGKVFIVSKLVASNKYTDREGQLQ